MLDKDLAILYEIETRTLNQAVKRNITRFPEDFMFQLTQKEMDNWRSQIVMSNREKMGLRRKPYAFTEQGVAMLSSVLNSERAIQANIQIMRTFTRLMQMLTCPLCNKKVKEFHKRSHLIPEWMYTDCYDEKHKILEISRLKQKVEKRQQGIYAQFICKNCEKETQIFDHYASLILTDKSPDSPEYKCISKDHYEIPNKDEVLKYEIWENIDFLKFQRFVLSIILRTQLAEKMSGQISLTKKHLKNILNLYRDNDNNDDSSYPIVVFKNPKNDKFRNQVTLPCINKHEGHHVITFTGAGFIFNIYVSSHRKSQCVNSMRLKNNGSILLINIFFHETGLFRDTKLMIKEARNVSK